MCCRVLSGLQYSALSLLPSYFSSSQVSRLLSIIYHSDQADTVGMPLLEEKSDKRHGGKEDYLEYKNSTSPLLLLPPALYRALPSPLQCFFFCEFPIYNKTLNTDPEQSPIT